MPVISKFQIFEGSYVATFEKLNLGFIQRNLGGVFDLISDLIRNGEPDICNDQENYKGSNLFIDLYEHVNEHSKLFIESKEIDQFEPQQESSDQICAHNDWILILIEQS